MIFIFTMTANNIIDDILDGVSNKLANTLNIPNICAKDIVIILNSMIEEYGINNSEAVVNIYMKGFMANEISKCSMLFPTTKEYMDNNVLIFQNSCSILLDFFYTMFSIGRLSTFLPDSMIKCKKNYFINETNSAETKTYQYKKNKKFFKTIKNSI